MSNGDGRAKYSFREDVFPCELDVIKARKLLNATTGEVVPRGDGLPDFDALLKPDSRMSAVFENVKAELLSEQNNQRWMDDDTAPHKGLVGLAFSGGGIRSATYNLGVLQALKRLGLFRCVDYLSTVSGGGYIGSCFSSTLASLDADPDVPDGSGAGTKPTAQDETDQDRKKDKIALETLQAAFGHEQGKQEPNIFRHLRDNANYLAPNGFLDILTIPALVLRGIFINFLVILPWILLAVMATIVVHAVYNGFADLVASQGTQVSGWRGMLSDIHGAFSAVYSLGSFPFTKILMIFLGLLFFFYPLMQRLDATLGWVSKSKWEVRKAFGKGLGLMLAATAGVAFIELQPHAIALFGKLDQIDVVKTLGKEGVAVGSGVLGTVLSLFAPKLLPKISKFFGRLAFYVIGLLGFCVFWVLYLFLSSLAIEEAAALGSAWNVFENQYFVVYLIVAVVLAAYTARTVDVNFTGVHKFYRDRLSRAYIVGLAGEATVREGQKRPGEIVHTDEVKLSNLNTRHGPYHLINALLNLNRVEEEYKNGRNGDFFIFSKKFIGGETTGYCKTAEMQKVSPNLDLATAMAVSGAAAAPNMGKITIKPLIFVLAMLNVRLNYWILNPSYVPQETDDAGIGTIFSRIVNRVGPMFLIRELFGANTVKKRYVNLSDGGHLENLGAYELIRRECRLIFIGDGEADPELKFEGLAEFVRMVQIDLGIRIDIDGLDEIRRGEQHHAIGTINYANGRIGKLIYMKSSLLGDNNLIATLGPENYTTSPHRDDNQMFDENAFIANYRASNPSFPHQTTGDQFFDEAQFECYRALGFAVAMDVLRARDFAVPHE